MKDELNHPSASFALKERERTLITILLNQWVINHVTLTKISLTDCITR